MPSHCRGVAASLDRGIRRRELQLRERMILTWQALRVRGLGWAGLAVIALGAAGCSSGSTFPSITTPGDKPNSHLTAVQEAGSWFKAINAKDRTASLDHFNPEARYMGDWNGGLTTRWPTFTNVNCTPFRSSTSSSTVHCTFRSHGDPSSAADTFWNVELHRTVGGPWLITNYGQG